MRLIDADALIDDLKHDVAMDEDSLCYEDLTDINRANIQNDKDIKQNAIDLLNHTPTIYPERKTGRWILVNDSNGQHCICEFCGEWKYHQKQKFCGECGADMEGDKDDKERIRSRV